MGRLLVCPDIAPDSSAEILLPDMLSTHPNVSIFSPAEIEPICGTGGVMLD
ncbi:MAG: hypothetical protein JWN70_6918, partial [Planctomycetaceae bacterium]|nr:hypothetical protein [Planctomycetaceae bacterium]